MIGLLRWALPRLANVVVILVSLGLGGLAWAAPPVVKTVPWVASNPLIPHDAWSGKQITLKGSADVQGGNIASTWDFGDGSPVTTGTVNDQYIIEATHTYTGAVGAIFTARLTVQNTTTGETGSREYYVQLRDKTLQVEVNVAVDEGLWRLHKTMTKTTVVGSSGNEAAGHWEGCNGYSGYNCSGWYGITPTNLLAFEVNGHLPDGGADNPYTETVQRALRWLFARLTTYATSLQTYPAPIGQVNPDSNNNGYGVHVDQSHIIYQTGMFIDAIIASGTPNASTTTGQTPTGSNPGIRGRAYKDIVQDLVDFYAEAQYNGNDAGRGGWRYGFNEYPDNSTSQWAAIGLIPAERRWGLTVPTWVKSENLAHWLPASQYSDGGFGYQPGYWYPWGPYATSASGMVQLAMDGAGRGNPLWDRAETFMRDRFCNTGGATEALKSYYYGLFSFTKSMLLHDSNGDGTAEPITLLQSTTAGVQPIDWYSAETSKGDPCDGVARTLIDAQYPVNNQSEAGFWWCHEYTGEQCPFETGWTIVMLKRTVFETGQPVAVAQAIPNPAVAGQTIALNGTGSFHQDPNRKITTWEWDVNNDGVFDASGASITTAFPTLGAYPVKLRVTDDSAPPLTNDTVVIVRITTPPLAPTATAGGPYVFCPGQKWFLDGTRSINPDEGLHEPGKPGDTIQRYQWDLDGNNDFTDASGPQPDVTGYFGGRGVGSYLVQLKVTDTTATSFPSSNQPDLSSTDIAQVSVKDASDTACQCITDLSARTKSGKVELLWKDTSAHHYNVYKGTAQGGPYSLLAATDSRYAVYVDFAVTNGTTYYYVVREAQASGAERCQSNEARITPNDRTVRNRAPVFELHPRDWRHRKRTLQLRCQRYRSRSGRQSHLLAGHQTQRHDDRPGDGIDPVDSWQRPGRRPECGRAGDRQGRRLHDPNLPDHRCQRQQPSQDRVHSGDHRHGVAAV